MVSPLVRQVPANDARTIDIVVAKERIGAFINDIMADSDVLSWHGRPNGATTVLVTVDYAVMDLEVHVAAISQRIQRAAKPANTPQRVDRTALD